MALYDDWRANSPFYNSSHEEWAQTVRRFVDKEIMPHVEAWESAGEVPRALHLKAAEIGLLQQGFPEEYGGISHGVDMYHGLVATEELAKTGASGLQPALMIHSVALAPIIKLGTEEMKQRIAPEGKFVGLMSHGCSGDIYRVDYTVPAEQRPKPTIDE